MEAFVSDLLENADLGVITKKDVRVKYKNFVGRDISSEEKAKINDLVYAFVFYYAAKQKKLEDSKQKSVGPSLPGDKENKLAHIKEKGMKNGKHVSSINSQVLKGQVSDKVNIKNLKRKHSLEREYTDREKNSTGPTRRKSYPMRQRKQLPGIRYDDAISAVIESASENSDSDPSESSDSDLELDEDEKEKIKLAVKKLQAEREIKIQLALARKKASLRKIGKECLVLKRINDVKNVAIKNSTPINSGSDESVSVLSDFGFPDSEDDPACVKVKSQNKQMPPSEDCGDLTVNKTDTNYSKHKKKIVSSDEKKDSVHGKMKSPIKQMPPSEDSGDLTVNKTETNYNKHKKKIMSSDEKKDSISGKVNKMKRPIKQMPPSEDSGDLTVKKTETNYNKQKKKIMSSDEKKDSISGKVNKIKIPIKQMPPSEDCGDLTVNKTLTNYTKHKKKIMSSNERRDSISGKMKRPIKQMPPLEDSGDLTANKTDTNDSKHKKKIVSSDEKKDSVHGKMKSQIKQMPPSEDSGDLTVNKTLTNYTKHKKKVMTSDEKKDSFSGKVNKMKRPIKQMPSSEDSGDLTVNKTLTNYTKHKRKITPSDEKKNSVGGKVNKIKRNKRLKTDSESEQDTQPLKKKPKMALGIKVRKKLAHQVEIMKLVKRKREAGALTKLKKTGKIEKCCTGEITVTNKEKLSTECDKHIMNDCTESKLDTIRDQNRVVCETDSTSGPLSSEVSDCDNDSFYSMDKVDGRLNDSLKTLCTSDTDSPIKTTSSPLAKKEHEHLVWTSDEESRKNVSELKESKAALGKGKNPLVLGEDFQPPCEGSEPNKNGVTIISEDSSDEDEPLSQIKAKIRMDKVLESPYVLQLRKVCKASGICVRADRQLKDCSSNDEKIVALKNILKDAGMKGQPNMNKAEELLLLKEAADLNRKNILSTTKTGRAMRNVKSIYARPNIAQLSEDESTENGIMSPVDRLKGIFDSESSA